MVPKLPRNAIVTIDFGFNGTGLTQVGATPNTLRNANCVNGEPESEFGQVSFCNGINFFTAAHLLEAEGRLGALRGHLHQDRRDRGALGTGQACPTTHNFDMVDQDPSDNVTTEYLLYPATGQTAQDTASNAGNIAGSMLLLNGSDNTLLDLFMDPILGCIPFQVPDLANNDQPTSSQALDELLAEKAGNLPKLPPLSRERRDDAERRWAVRRGQDRPVPGRGRPDAGQRAEQPDKQPGDVLPDMVNIQTPFLAANQTLLATGQAPVTGVGDNLFTFLANRLSMSFTNLACQNFGLPTRSPSR